MATYVFDLHGCTEAKAAQVAAAIRGIKGVISVSVTKTSRGDWIAVVDSDLDEDVLLTLINAAIAHLGVRATKSGPSYKPPKP